MNYHTPKKLPINIDYAKIAKNLSNAQYYLGRLDGRQSNLQNPLLLIAPLTAKEATVSSKIEGTQSTISDVFLHEAGEETKYSDVIEVSNYKKAILYAKDELIKKPLTLNLIKNTHAILLENTRGESRRGDLRTDQVWLGLEGDPIEKASYIPPKPELVPDYMYNLEEFINTKEDDALIQAALTHYQFEAVHPFNDGNGRIGRLLIPLVIYYRKKLSLPILYLSGYFENNKQAYIKALHKVDLENDYEYWINYFLEAVAYQAVETETLINKILELFNVTRTQVEEAKSPYMSKLVEFIFKKPVFSVPMISDYLKCHRATSLRLVSNLKSHKIITEFKAPKTNRNIYIFSELIKLL